MPFAPARRPPHGAGFITIIKTGRSRPRALGSPLTASRRDAAGKAHEPVRHFRRLAERPSRYPPQAAPAPLPAPRYARDRPFARLVRRDLSRGLLTAPAGAPGGSWPRRR